MKLKIAVLAGDGIGPEVTHEAVNILKAVAEFGGHDFTFVPLPPRRSRHHRARHPAPHRHARPRARIRRRPPRRRRRQQVQLPHRPTSAPRPASCRSARPWAASPTSAPHSPITALADNSPLRPEVTKGVDILFVRELLGGLYFGAAPLVEQETDEAINTMRYTKDEVVRVARIAFELAAKRRRKSPPSTRPTSSKSPSSGAPPSPKSRRNTQPSPSSTSSSTPWPCTS